MVPLMSINLPPRLPSRSLSRSKSRALGWVLGIVIGLVVVLASIGFGVQMQAQHHIAAATTTASTVL
jgi:hypothetical protein